MKEKEKKKVTTCMSCLHLRIMYRREEKVVSKERSNACRWCALSDATKNNHVQKRRKKIHNQPSRHSCVFRPETVLESKVQHGEFCLSRCSSEPLLKRKPGYNPENEVIWMITPTKCAYTRRVHCCLSVGLIEGSRFDSSSVHLLITLQASTIVV